MLKLSVNYLRVIGCQNDVAKRNDAYKKVCLGNRKKLLKDLLTYQSTELNLLQGRHTYGNIHFIIVLDKKTV